MEVDALGGATFVPEGLRVDRFLARHPGCWTHATLLQALQRNPRMSWTVANLAGWYGIRIDNVRAILGELLEWEIVRRVSGPQDRYRWNAEIGASGAEGHGVPSSPARRSAGAPAPR